MGHAAGRAWRAVDVVGEVRPDEPRRSTIDARVGVGHPPHRSGDADQQEPREGEPGGRGKHGTTVRQITAPRDVWMQASLFPVVISVSVTTQ